MRYITLDIIRPRQERWFWDANEISLRLNIRLLIRIKLILIRINKREARDLIFSSYLYIYFVSWRRGLLSCRCWKEKWRILPFVHFIKIFYHDNNVFSTFFLEKKFALRCIYTKVKDMNKNWIYLLYILPSQQRRMRRPQAVWLLLPPKSCPTPGPSWALCSKHRSTITDTLSARKDVHASLPHPFACVTPNHWISSPFNFLGEHLPNLID